MEEKLGIQCWGQGLKSRLVPWVCRLRSHTGPQVQQRSMLGVTFHCQCLRLLNFYASGPLNDPLSPGCNCQYGGWESPLLVVSFFGSPDRVSIFLWTLLSQEADHMDCIRNLPCPLAVDLVPIIGSPSRSSRGHCFSQEVWLPTSLDLGSTAASIPCPSKACLRLC